MQPAYPLYLLRHGQTEWNRDDKRQGQLDSPLTQQGYAQAEAMGRTLAKTLDHKLDWRLVASPLGRAYQTAEIVSVQTNLNLTVDERLMEIAMGSWEGLTWPEIQALGPYDTAVKYPQFHIPDGESFAAISARAKSWLASIDRPTIAVSHGMMGLVLRAVYLGLDEAGLSQWATPGQDVFYYLDGGRVEEIECK